MKAIIKSTFPEGINANIDIQIDKKIEVCIDNTIPFNLTPVPDDTIRFFVTTEPVGDYNQRILNHRDSFTYLLTQYPDLLHLPNAVRLMGCGSFVDPNPYIKKKFGVSMVITTRHDLPGHSLRQELYQRRKEIKIPFDIYAGTWNETFIGEDTILLPPWPNRKEKVVCMDTMFHICIEGIKNDHHYSEKIIDPLITKTIPIYWGCTEIEKHFDINGMLIVQNVDDIINVCNNLTPYTHKLLLPYVENNYNKGLKLYRYEDILRDAMLRALYT